MHHLIRTHGSEMGRKTLIIPIRKKNKKTITLIVYAHGSIFLLIRIKSVFTGDISKVIHEDKDIHGAIQSELQR